MRTIASELGLLARHLNGVPLVYADANIPAGVIALMRQRLGWDVIYVVEHDEWRRARDRDHFIRALDLGRTLITLDRDFLDDTAFPPALSPGVIICSAADQDVLVRLLRHVDESVFRGASGPCPLRGRKLSVTVADLG